MSEDDFAWLRRRLTGGRDGPDSLERLARIEARLAEALKRVDEEQDRAIRLTHELTRVWRRLIEAEARCSLLEMTQGGMEFTARLARYEKALREIATNEYDDSGDGPNYVTIARAALAEEASE